MVTPKKYGSSVNTLGQARKVLKGKLILISTQASEHIKS